MPRYLYDITKRGLDVGLSLVLFLLSLPLILLSCSLILLTTGRSPLLRQVRIGEQGRAFVMLKLRTMRIEDESVEPAPPAPGQFLIGKTMGDPRVTRIGRVLRRSSIDELPQLLNVLLGQMSLVGPRPGLPVEVARYPHSWRRRLGVKPGLTGLWQVSGRSDLSFCEMMDLDIRYVEEWSIRRDILLLLRTPLAVLSARGAY